MMKFELTGIADLIDKELGVFTKEAEKEYTKQLEIAKTKMKGKLSMLPVKVNLDFPPLVLTHVKKDENTVLLFSNLGGDNKTVTGKMLNMVFKRANKKMVHNLEGYFKAKGLKVKVKIIDN